MTFRARERLGIERYGKALPNGRSMEQLFQDALEEALDQVMYLRAALEELRKERR